MSQPAASAAVRIARSIERRAKALVGRPLFWVLALALFFLVPISRTLAIGRAAPPPPALKLPLPSFELTDQHGRRFGLADLKGKIWVADFVFTSCPTVCPKLTKRMTEVQNRGKNLGDAFHLVTFTVDPENDTPDKLRAYAESFHVNQRRWSFLTGPLGEMETTVIKGFKIAMGKDEEVPGIFSIFHGERLVLVDPEGNIRGYYEADDEGIDRLMVDMNLVVNAH
jgi:protein SCO1